MSARTDQIDQILLEQTVRPSQIPRPRSTRKPLRTSIQEWAGSQVSAYRVGLVLGYVFIMYYGASAIVAGVPVFIITTPDPSEWTRYWGIAVIVGGLVAGIGAIRAGAEPATKEVKVFNSIELAGSAILFVALGTYAALLLILGYGYGDAARASVGAGFLALGVHPAVRMVWLIFRPRFLALKSKHIDPLNIVVPHGHALFAVNDAGSPTKVVAVAPTASVKLPTPSEKK